MISEPLKGSIKSHLILIEGLAENCEVFVVSELLLKFLPAVYFGRPIAWRSIDGYLCDILLDRLKFEEISNSFNDLSSSLFKIIDSISL